MHQSNPENILKKEQIVTSLYEDLDSAVQNLKLGQSTAFSSFEEYLDELHEHLPKPNSLTTVLLANKERNLKDGASNYEIKVFKPDEYQVQYKELAEYCDQVMEVDNPDRSERIFLLVFMSGLYHVCPIHIHLKNKGLEVTILESINSEEQINAFQKYFVSNLGSAKGLVDLVCSIPDDFEIQAGSFECGIYSAYTADVLCRKTDAELQKMREEIRSLSDKELISAPAELIKAAQSRTTVASYTAQVRAIEVVNSEEIIEDIQHAKTNLSLAVKLKNKEVEKTKEVNGYIWHVASQYFDSAITYAEAMEPDELIRKITRMSKGDADKEVSTDEPMAKRPKIDFGRG